MVTTESLLKEIETSLSNLYLPKTPLKLYEPISYILSVGGKRIRPLSVLLGCYLFDDNYKKAMPAALAVEIFHNFTLVHDDIMDNAPLRRGRKTIHEKWEVNTAILSGDAMNIYAYQQLERLPSDKYLAVFHEFNNLAIGVCEGQQLDMDYEKNETVTIAEYLKMIELKTSVLLGGSFKIGAILGNASAQDIADLYEFGRNVGLAFQMQDDILDVFGKPDKVGKKIGGDIVANKKTFLLLKALELANDKQKIELLHLIDYPINENEKVEKVTNIYLALDVKKIAENVMKLYFDKALNYLEAVKVNYEKKQMIKQLFVAIMNRES